ncbi:hypothetical protein [Swingsia samuiensis]|uniref:Uncharacterized protein n=1 Tax=Swingsia samuiensis TaxID=1293412 RepID=A0A4Y6UHU9_9PROT|nr:hypothetical protein [Swingsia samuiensis]QDH16390.1 hypothetical protein E3D00_01520 [Swingsia samuiensis]
MDMQPPRHITERLQHIRSGDNGPFSTAGLIKTIIWSICYFFFYFGQQVAELLAPIFLILGIGWYLLPHIVSAITTSAASADPQAKDIMNHVAGTLPTHLQIAGHYVTATSLIFDGFLLMALAAIGATLSALTARQM